MQFLEPTLSFTLQKSVAQSTRHLLVDCDESLSHGGDEGGGGLLHDNSNRSLGSARSRQRTFDEKAAFLRQPKNMYQVPLDEVPDFQPPVYNHSSEEQITLTGSLKFNFIFSALGDQELKQLVAAFEPCEFKGGEEIIRQGDLGDYFYVLKEGKVRFEVNGKSVGSTGEKGASFGELALLYNCPRAASVVSETEHCKLFRVDQTMFRHILRSQTRKSTQQKKDLLKGLPFLNDLPETAIVKLANNMTPRFFKANETLCRKGDPGDKFYVIHEGSLVCKDITVGNKTFEDLALGPGEYFGERAIITSEPRVANVVSTTKGVAFSIDKETFERVLGKMSDLIMKSQDARTLGGVPCIRKVNISADQLDAIADQVVEKKYKKGDVIFIEGDIVEACIYLIRSEGQVRLKAKGKDDILSGGAYFGEQIVEAAMENRDVVSNAPYSAIVEKDTVCGELLLKHINHIVDAGLEEAEDLRRRLEKQTLEGEKDTLKTKGKLRHLPAAQSIKLEDLKRHEILGEGTFGQVWLVSNTKDENSPPYALKIQTKMDLAQEGQAAAVIRERNIMAKMKHPFIVKLLNSYQDEHFIYVLLEMCQGGELFSVLHESDADFLPEKQAKFYALAIADALVYMHRGRYVFRDLKPENVLIDAKGYPKIVDFGFAKQVKDKTFTVCGTPGYISPECLIQRGYDMSVDHWAIGILIYEMVTGSNPFYLSVGMNQIELFRSICRDDYDPPKGASTEVTDLIARLLTKDPTRRIGSLARGPDEILEHAWFRTLDLHALRKRKLKAPWVPEIEDPFDLAFFNDWSELEDKKKVPQVPLSKKQQALFKDF